MVLVVYGVLWRRRLSSMARETTSIKSTDVALF
jgi:hypothetical protein